MARVVNDFFSKESRSEKKCYFFAGVMVREDWLV